MYRHTPTRFEQKGKKTQQQWENREFKRLIWALLLFLTVFLGRKIYPERVLAIGEEVVAVIGSSTDLKAVFSKLGESVAHSEMVLQGLEEFCVEVFGPRREISVPQETAIAPQLPQTTAGLLGREISAQSVRLTHLMILDEGEGGNESLPVGAIVSLGNEEQTPPEGYTMHKLHLGEMETAVPVMGTITSEFGYRNHPISGKYLFHGGIDIGAEEGTPIAAFADGEVEYVGEDSSYGLYVQLDHGNGVKSFYAHCQSLCVRKGNRVNAGETVALVGTSGKTTGAHLHLELKCGELRVDPSHYMTFSTQA